MRFVIPFDVTCSDKDRDEFNTWIRGQNCPSYFTSKLNPMVLEGIEAILSNISNYKPFPNPTKGVADWDKAIYYVLGQRPEPSKAAGGY